MKHIVETLLPDDNAALNDSVQIREQADYDAIIPYAADEDQVEAFTTEEVEDVITSPKSNKATGLDLIKGKVAQLIHPYIGSTLVGIYNACWKFRYFPKQWKNGKMIILLKDPTGRADVTSNYKPIVLLPTYGKVLER